MKEPAEVSENRTESLVLGLGEVGGPLLTVLSRAAHRQTAVHVPVHVPGAADEGAAGTHRVWGYDPAMGWTPPSANPGGPGHGGVALLHVCFPFPPGGTPDAFARLVAVEVERFGPTAAVVIHSTVSPGTTHAVAAACPAVPVVYSPVRGKHGQMDSDLLRYTKFVAGTCAQAVGRVAQSFNAVGMRTARVVDPTALELAKLYETTYLGLLVAWAQEMQRLATVAPVQPAEQSGEEANQETAGVAAAFFAEVPYLPEFSFAPGVLGGHCVLPNLDLLRRFAKEAGAGPDNSDLAQSSQPPVQGLPTPMLDGIAASDSQHRAWRRGQGWPEAPPRRLRPQPHGGGHRAAALRASQTSESPPDTPAPRAARCA